MRGSFDYNLQYPAFAFYFDRLTRLKNPVQNLVDILAQSGSS
jgi:hypothetical protein